jgi:hypothetical protein
VTLLKALGASGAEGPRGFVTAKRQYPSNQIAQKKQNRPAKGRTPQPRPEPKPAARPLDPLAGLEHIGSLVVLGVDSTGKRTLTRCSCGEVREISTESLRTGERRSCGACGGSRRS